MSTARNDVILFAVVLIGFAWTACNREEDERSAEVPQVIEEIGAIESTDTRDPNHGNLAYDAFTFYARPLNIVSIEVAAENFTPLLKLVEVTTGAVLAEWDTVYSTGDRLTYTIAGPGTYEARVYAMEGGTGTYSVTIIVTP